ncbi:restriction endonuclease subunit S [Acinetobacter sp. ANC 4633]|uniref:restriction endonuclease subunit S n=1 Tax=Acinetobacter sp. ANC 4633 TaxID=2529845 RepID=UPI001BC88B2E|nr:restriction endonuclease subunit S [Acinetobacter sp. ANC 4633]
MSEWFETTLGEQVILLTGFPFKSKDYSDSEEDIKLLRGDNIAQGYLRWENAKRWKLTDDIREQNYFLEKEDVILAMDRPWIEAGLKYSIISSQDLPCLLVQRVACLRAKETLSQQFLRYVIGSKSFTEYVCSIETGTAVPHISASQIKDFSFYLPPLSEQKAIASVLSSLDDKIDLLHRQNKTLEAMAETLFRQWFIEEAKDDWNETKVLDVFLLVGGGTPKTSEADYWDGDILWLSGGDIANAHQGFIVSAEKSITELGLQKSSTKLLPKLASVISARGTVGKYASMQCYLDQ